MFSFRRLLKGPKVINYTTVGPRTQMLTKIVDQYKKDPTQITNIWRNLIKQNPEVVGKSHEEGELTKEYNVLDDLREELVVFDQIQVYRVMGNYESNGHLSASLDPLNIQRPQFVPNSHFCPRSDIDSTRHIPLDKDKQIILPDNCFIGGEQSVLNLRDILVRLNRSYCQSVGVEYLYNTSLDICQWIRRKFEEPALLQSMYSPKLRTLILRRLIRAHCFEEFISSKWPSEREHGAMGCEMLIPALLTLIDFGTTHGAQSFVLGMTTTRARLNVLANVFRKPLQQIFVPFYRQGMEGPELHDDDKYDLGNNVKKVTTNQALPTEFAVLASTSNFVEAIDSLVSGKTRAEQLYTSDDDGRRVWPIIIHGDTVMNGQGMVHETLRLSNQPCFSTKGTIHIVLTDQSNLPSDKFVADKTYGNYCTDVAHAVMAPVFHVNGEDPEAVVYCMQAAAEYRAKFKSDIIVDLICYRKYFPPESQIPSDLKAKIDAKRPLLEIYSERLVNEQVVSWYDIDHIIESYNSLLEYSYSKALKSTFKVSEWLDSPWKRFFEKKLPTLEPVTGMVPSAYKRIVESIVNYRPDINVHPSVIELIMKDIKLLHENKITWAMAERLAFAFMLQFLKKEINSFLNVSHILSFLFTRQNLDFPQDTVDSKSSIKVLIESINVRLTGDSCEHGEYIQRHHALYAVDKNASRIPLRALYKAQGYYTVCNSLSAEFANLGFELGFSQTNPKSLIVWENNSHDNACLAQYMIDVFLAAGEGRWFRQTGIVCLMPHGIEGMGDSASSARPERFLQMCNDDPYHPITNMVMQLASSNWVVANVTTPANYFHILRRQMKLNFRKPLILFTHKKIYKRLDIFSHREEFLNKTRFIVYFGDKGIKHEEVQKIILCTGRVYYDLIAKREKYPDRKGKIALCRVEQISPFPYEEMIKDLGNFSGGAQVTWVQEEPRNQGWWGYVRPRILATLLMIKERNPEYGVRAEVYYVGRPTSALTASNCSLEYAAEKETFLTQAIHL